MHQYQSNGRLTDKNEMKKGYFNIEEFEGEVGFESTFEGNNKARIYVHL